MKEVDYCEEKLKGKIDDSIHDDWGKIKRKNCWLNPYTKCSSQQPHLLSIGEFRWVRWYGFETYESNWLL